MTTVRRGTKVPPRWLLCVCGLFVLASCLLAAQTEVWVPSPWAAPLQLNPYADLPAPTRISHGEFSSKHADGVASPIRRTLKASVPAAFRDVLAFYRTELPKLGWKEMPDGAAVAAERAELSFNSPEGPAILKLGRAKDETTIDLLQRNTEAAAKANILPMPGQARLIFGYLVPDVASLAINGQIIKIAGGLNHPQTLDLPPGTYSYELLVSGHLMRTDTITVAAGEAWSLSLSNDDRKPDQIY